MAKRFDLIVQYRQQIRVTQGGAVKQKGIGRGDMTQQVTGGLLTDTHGTVIRMTRDKFVAAFGSEITMVFEQQRCCVVAVVVLKFPKQSGDVSSVADSNFSSSTVHQRFVSTT